LVRDTGCIEGTTERIRQAEVLRVDDAEP